MLIMKTELSKEKVEQRHFSQLVANFQLRRLSSLLQSSRQEEHPPVQRHPARYARLVPLAHCRSLLYTACLLGIQSSDQQRQGRSAGKYDAQRTAEAHP